MGLCIVLVLRCCSLCSSLFGNDLAIEEKADCFVNSILTRICVCICLFVF